MKKTLITLVMAMVMAMGCLGISASACDYGNGSKPLSYNYCEVTANVTETIAHDFSLSDIQFFNFRHSPDGFHLLLLDREDNRLIELLFTAKERSDNLAVGTSVCYLTSSSEVTNNGKSFKGTSYWMTKDGRLVVTEMLYDFPVIEILPEDSSITENPVKEVTPDDPNMMENPIKEVIPENVIVIENPLFRR